MVLYFITLSSCSVSSIKKNEINGSVVSRPISNPQSIPLRIKINIHSNLNEDREKVWISLLKENSAIDYLQACEETECDCQLNIDINDDEETFNSWKIYLSGFSLGFIPVKFSSKLKFEIKKGAKIDSFNSEITTWRQILLFPLAIITPGKITILKKIFHESSLKVKNFCEAL